MASSTRPAIHPGLNAHYRPSDTAEAMADRLEADGVVIVRTEYGFRTRNAAERAADAAQATKWAAE